MDLTKGRFDFAAHPVAPAPGRTLGNQQTWTYAQQWKLDGWRPKDLVDEWYNAETDGDRALPRQPWHDVHAKLDGPAAWEYLRMFHSRRHEGILWPSSLAGKAPASPRRLGTAGGLGCLTCLR